MNEVSLYGCLAEGTRLTVLKRLAEAGPASVSDLVEATGKEQSNVSHHLRQLRECGLVVGEPDGRRRLYRLAHPRLADLLREGAELVDHIEAADAEACLVEGCC
jgi:DNA-binding transcriptional ArsR family regulator